MCISDCNKEGNYDADDRGGRDFAVREGLKEVMIIVHSKTLSRIVRPIDICMILRMKAGRRNNHDIPCRDRY